jgi:uncharacterized RDD family membrane protein YckC
MNTELLDDSEFKEEHVEYPTLGARLIASLLDFFMIGIPTGIISFYNVVYVDMQSALLAYLLVFVFPVYKMYMEGTYGYTIGKKLQGFKIVKQGGGENEMDLKTSILRYLFGLPLVVISLITTIYTFDKLVQAEVISLSDYVEKSGAIQAFVPSVFDTLSNVISFVYLVAVLFIFQGGKCQTLYDRIAKTICVVDKD